MKTQTRFHRSWRIVIGAMTGAAMPAIANAQPLTYTIQELPALESNRLDRFSSATGMNELGHVAGVAYDDLGSPHAVIWIDGVIAADLRNEPPVVPGSTFPWAKGINNLGQTVGQGTEPYPTGGSQGCAMSHEGSVGLFNPRNGEVIGGGGWAWAINDSGQIGFRAGSTYIYDPVDGVREVSLPDGSWEIWEINNSGVATGAGRGANGRLHAFRYDYDTDTIVDLADTPLLESHSQGYGLNELGDIAGWSGVVGSFRHPIVWADDGRVIILETGDMSPAHLLATAEHINTQGDVVGDDVSVASENPIGWIAYDVLGVGQADLTTTGAGIGVPGYGVPDGEITGADINYYVNFWVGNDLGIADLTTTGAAIGDPGYGVPDGQITGADINYYVNAWVAGPVVATKHMLRGRLSPADQTLWSRLHPFEINDAGQICGIGVWNGTTRGFLMTPVPSN